MQEDLEQKWLKFVKKYDKTAFEKVDHFLTDLEKAYKEQKIKLFVEKGVDTTTAIGKARQSWVVYVGDSLENIIRLITEPIVKKYGAKLIRDKEIQRSKLNEEHDRIRRELLVHFDKYSYLPDADLIVYRYEKETVKIVAIISVKNSFRERYTETPYWKLKLIQSDITKRIKVFMVTTDRDDEISFGEKPSKARVVLEYELDGIYITKNKNEFHPTKKIGSLHDLLEILEKLLKN